MSETATGWKVVRDDYTDCYSGKVRYVVGETTTIRGADRMSRDTCGVGLHLCHRPEDTMRFRQSQWPVRLLAVSSDDVIARDDTKARCGSIYVEREESLARCFGPNCTDVASLLVDLAGIGWLQPTAPVTTAQLQPLADEHLRRLARFGASVGPVSVRIVTDGDAAWDAAWDAARATAWDAAMATARDAARATAWDAARDAAWDAARATAWDAARATAWDAAWDAAHRVVADLLDWPSPWEPLLDIWRLGCYPVGVVRGEFVVFVPPAKGDGVDG